MSTNKTQLMATSAAVIAFRPHADGESASVVVEVLYPDHGHSDILRGTSERDGQARGWTHVHRASPAERASLHSIGPDGKPLIYNQIRRPEFWSALEGDELLGPNTAGCRRPLQPFVGGGLEAEIERDAAGYEGKRYSEMGPFEKMLHLTDRIIAAADQAVYAFWNHHPSSCPVRDLEASIRGEDVVRRQPILRPRIDHYDAAIERAEIDEREAQDAYFMCTLTNSLRPDVNRHVTILRTGPGKWVIEDVSGIDPDDVDEHYYGDVLFAPNRDDLQIGIEENGAIKIKFD